MSRIDRTLNGIWNRWGTRVLPFADVASPDLPLSRLLRLSLIQVSVGMSLTLLVGTLNRVMIVELDVPSTIVGVMLALPLLFAPFRALIGFRSDTHRSALGWRRVPFIYRGTMIQFGGLAIMPFALLVLAKSLNAALAPDWVGQMAAAIAILLVGAGIHITQTVGLALATDLAPEHQQANVVGLMYVSLLMGSIVSALAFGAFLVDFSPGRLIQVIQASAVITVLLNFIATWKQEARRPARLLTTPLPPPPTFKASWNSFIAQNQALRRLVAVGLGTLAFTMEDILLEPYGGQVLGLGVGATTKLTATFAGGSLVGFAMASQLLSRGGDPFRMASAGALIGLPAFVMVMASAPMQAPQMFNIGVLLIGLGAGLFGHGTLTATMNNAPPEQAGMALGAWGAVQATAAGAGAALGGGLRDLGSGLGFTGPWPRVADGYMLVYGLEVLLLVITLLAMLPLIRRKPG
ncbi:MFS transporter [Polymorphobacter multimanifer]|uniref:BCD family chlorophyll transporter-like MFS transporter n=1 Tax=Polymorphobacter multimanifer TaxID=1070431 RepID=A0A841LAZ0_9SPHN|nr:PucC family protein [Polymorphobacter multimanifer]MBB6228821.1 BCD family chlorophyll transporter-like MFS transporter [Polymorphobacter multimanifer]GGI89120.1 MFS transporter [Polymorphobacter multimanifer]